MSGPETRLFIITSFLRFKEHVQMTPDIQYLLADKHFIEPGIGACWAANSRTSSRAN